MPRLKRTSSKIIQIAAARAAGLESIDTKLDLGGDMTLTAYKNAIVHALEKQSAYNTLLSQADEAKDVFDAVEKKTNDHTERILAAVAARYGRSSIEYEQAGGKAEVPPPASGGRRV